jgi:hypothetical protein
MTFEAFEGWWWHFLFIFIAGAVATDAWRFLGVAFGERIPEKSEALVLVRSIATALVAAVIGNLIAFPSGTLADLPLSLRLAAAVAGFGTFLAGGHMLLGIAIAEAMLVIGMMLG